MFDPVGNDKHVFFLGIIPIVTIGLVLSVFKGSILLFVIFVLPFIVMPVVYMRFFHSEEGLEDDSAGEMFNWILSDRISIMMSFLVTMVIVSIICFLLRFFFGIN